MDPPIEINSPPGHEPGGLEVQTVHLVGELRANSEPDLGYCMFPPVNSTFITCNIQSEVLPLSSFDRRRDLTTFDASNNYKLDNVD